MIDNPNWEFSYAKQKAQEFGMNVKGIYGSARNIGSTPEGMKEILRAWPTVSHYKQIQCTVVLLLYYCLFRFWSSAVS